VANVKVQVLRSLKQILKEQEEEKWV
jgi:hypothetical protein